jgi:hypothetical protein
MVAPAEYHPLRSIQAKLAKIVKYETVNIHEIDRPCAENAAALIVLTAHKSR